MFEPQFSFPEFLPPYSTLSLSISLRLSRMIFHPSAAPLNGLGPLLRSSPLLSPFQFWFPFVMSNEAYPFAFVREKTDGTTSDFRVSTFAQFPHTNHTSSFPPSLPHCRPYLRTETANFQLRFTGAMPPAPIDNELSFVYTSTYRERLKSGP